VSPSTILRGGAAFRAKRQREGLEERRGRKEPRQVFAGKRARPGGIAHNIKDAATLQRKRFYNLYDVPFISYKIGKKKQRGALRRGKKSKGGIVGATLQGKGRKVGSCFSVLAAKGTSLEAAQDSEGFAIPKLHYGGGGGDHRRRTSTFGGEGGRGIPRGFEVVWVTFRPTVMWTDPV